jgi:predicted nucleic acid-binding protein
MKTVIADTGILIAYLNRREKFHSWAKEQLAKVSPPLITCEAVIAETCFLLQNVSGGTDKIFEMLEAGFIVVLFRLDKEIRIIRELMKHYADVPMSFADACLVRMSEQYSDAVILTLDSDFRIYRKNRRQKIPLIMPE